MRNLLPILLAVLALVLGMSAQQQKLSATFFITRG